MTIDNIPLDEPDLNGTIPPWGNPARILHGHPTFTGARHECAEHDVKWRGNDGCFICVDGAA